MKHHYLSQCYLRNFTSDQVPAGYEPFLWVADLRRKTVKPRAPKNVACIPDYYAGRLEDGTLDHRIETQLWGAIEDDAAPILRTVRSGTHDLSADELGVLVSEYGLRAFHKNPCCTAVVRGSPAESSASDRYKAGL